MDLAGTPNILRECDTTVFSGGPTAAVYPVSLERAGEANFLDEWFELTRRSSEPNPFFEPWFLLPSLQAFARDGDPAQLLAFRYEGRLAGVVPFAHSHDYYGYKLPFTASWMHANAFYGAPLVAQGFEHSFWHALLSYCDSHAGLSAFLHLPLLEENGPLDAALKHVLDQAGRANAIVARRQRAMLQSELTPDIYLAQALSKKHAKELRRQRRRLEEHGTLSIQRFADCEALDNWISQFLELEAAGWKGEAGSALANEKQTRTLFKAVMDGSARAGRLERVSLLLNGEPVAMLASFIAAPGRYSFKTAFDERYAAHSPGMQLQIENLAVLDRPDVSWTDSCASEGHPMIDRLWTERRSLVSRNVAIGGVLRRAIFRQISAYETRKDRA